MEPVWGQFAQAEEAEVSFVSVGRILAKCSQKHIKNINVCKLYEVFLKEVFVFGLYSSR